ncbi:hypothetical protein [Saccharibacillus kuerlensis]|uniref:Uncharacterized protein n=1 Tax=Saccharibacillus kuerlensis TaxID=459527 RepID=A0ABQ2L468_9BACL|nr:hypothetical protein [Saccharibacillus kuerlensis]GGO02247.1 hypothetical protein GCM10010969_25390 [Saccharibacillus kuerlensis]
MEMRENSLEHAKAHLIAEAFFQKRPHSVLPIIGKSFMNEVWTAESEGEKIIVRLNDKDPYAEKVFLKENSAWNKLFDRQRSSDPSWCDYT